ncbi:MAG: hypothetical protein AAB778_03400 [Patescibacteria group bacterium]
MARKKNFRDELQLLLYINIVYIILLLSIFNLSQKPKAQIQVLGAETDNSYWEEMVIKHPTYRDAWVELNRFDKVEEIDPNYK